VGKISKFHLTTHAERRINERGLSVEALKDVIKYHDHVDQQARGTHGGFMYRFQKTVDGKTLVVAAEVKKDECWIATGYYEALGSNNG
jgi:hypothetical protein